MRLKNTAADLEILDRLWGATEREVRRFCAAYAAASRPGEWSTDRQHEIADAAKERNYPKGVIRKIGDLMRRPDKNERRIIAQMAAFRAKIGL